MEWKEAILEVLKHSEQPRHYVDIADEIANKQYRLPSELGATPASSVNAVIGTSLRDDTSPFVRVARGVYALRAPPGLAPDITEEVKAAISETSGIVNALGMFWLRSKVVWKTEPRLLGKQQQDSQPIDFGGQIGIYFLHDSQGIVYVGRAIDQTLGRRLQQHTVDRLNGRWDRFSWFGLYPVENDGRLRTTERFTSIDVGIVISTLEAVLIEGLEPRQNRRRGDDFKAVEFLQSEDPEIEQSRMRAVVTHIASNLGIEI